MPGTLIFLRHGESVWNVENIFTGWHDVDLSPKGVEEAREAGRCLKAAGARFDCVFTSVLRRSVRTAWTACQEAEMFAMPIINNWRLNERHYGALQGLNKSETAAKHGEDQVKIWRRSYDVPPPPIELTDPRHPSNDPLYASCPQQALPGAESLADTVTRVVPFWNDQIAPAVRSGCTVLVVAHGNSIRALCKHIEGLGEKEVLDLNIPTAVPLVFEFDAKFKFARKFYLMDPDEVAKKMAAVAAQGKGGQQPIISKLERTKTLLQDVKSAATNTHYDLVILGGGPAGTKAAQEAASRGKDVAIIDPKAHLTGAPTGAHSKCLREAAILGAKTWAEVKEVTDRTLTNAAAQAARMMRTFHITHLKGNGTIIDEGKVSVKLHSGEELEVVADAMIIATGSKANRFPPTKYDIPGVYDSDTIWNVDRIPKLMIVQGCGIVSVEYALIFAKLGSKVKMFDAFPVFLGMVDESLREACLTNLKKHGVEVTMNMAFATVDPGDGSTPADPKVKIELKSGEAFECDLLLSACGRSGNCKGFGIEALEAKGLKVNPRGKLIEVDNFGYTGLGKVYACGDCATGSMGLATMGQAQALRAARKLYSTSGLIEEKLLDVKPFGVWTIPEIAWAGMTEDAAKKAELPYGTTVVPFDRTMKGCVTDESGFMKMIFNKETGVVLGVHLCGEWSCELINYGAQIVNFKRTIFEILNFVFPAVTYHNLYAVAAAEAKIRFLGANDLAAAMVWKRVKGMVQQTLIASQSPLTPVEALIDAFKEFDADNSGFLSKDELHIALKGMGIEVSMPEVQDMITEATGEENMPEMDYEAFLKVLQKDSGNQEEVIKQAAETEARRASRTPMKLLEKFLATETYDLVVLGGGCVGLRAAQEAASRGKRVTLIEPKEVLTGAPTGAHSKCLREAVLNGATTWAEVEAVMEKSVKNLASAAARTIRTFRINVIHGTGTILDEGKILVKVPDEEDRQINTDAIMVCTGSKSNRFPPTKFDLPGVYDSDTIWSIDRVPKCLVVQGAGIVSVEYALIFAKLGAKVKVIDAFDVFLPMIDCDLQAACRAMLELNGVEVIMGTPFKGMEAAAGSTPEAPGLRIDVGEKGFVECDCLLSACGRHGNTAGFGLEALAEKGVKVAARGKVIEVDSNGWTGCAKVYAAGDCATGSMGLATMGMAQGAKAARAMFTTDSFVSSEKGKEVKPFGVWTIPEIAWAGITEQTAKKEGKNYGVAKVHFKQTVKGCVANEDGFLKLIYDRGNAVVLGVHLCGENACELVNYGCEVVNDKQTIFQMLQFVFPAVTYHNLYLHAASEGKLRFMGAKDLGAATTWKRVQGLIQRSAGAEVKVADLMEEAFKLFDEDSSGLIDKSELKKAMANMGVPLEDSEVHKLVAEAMGEDEAEELDYESFMKMVTAM